MRVSALLTMTLAGRGSGPLSTRQADGTSKVCRQQTPVSSIPNGPAEPPVVWFLFPVSLTLSTLNQLEWEPSLQGELVSKCSEQVEHKSCW